MPLCDDVNKQWLKFIFKSSYLQEQLVKLQEVFVYKVRNGDTLTTSFIRSSLDTYVIYGPVFRNPKFTQTELIAIIWVFLKLQLISKIWQICLIFLPIIAKLKKTKCMVTHLSISIILNADCLTSVKWPFTLTALTFGSCLHCANVSYFKDGWAVNFNFFPQRDNRIPNLNASIKAQHKHEPTMRAVRVNGKITHVKQSALRIRWVTIWDPNILSFFSLAMIGKHIRQICQILLISLSFGKTQLCI